MTGRTWTARAVLAIGILGVSSAAILVRVLEAEEVGALTVAGWRMTLAAALLATALRATPGLEPGALRRELPGLLLAAACLAAHFATWTLSLYLIPVARSVLLVETQPVFVVLGAWWVLDERPSRRTLAFTAVAVAGAVVMVTGDADAARGDWRGDLLALAGAAALGAYVLVGRRLRGRLPVLHYTVPVYAAAGALLLLASAAGGETVLVGGGRVWTLFLALAVVPTLCGHTLFNWALRHVPAPVVSVAFLGEVPVASALAFVILSERPDTWTVIGGTIALAGIVGVVLSPTGTPGD